MKRFFLSLAAMALLFLTGCADGLVADTSTQGPAPFSADPNSHLPSQQTRGLDTPRY